MKRQSTKYADYALALHDTATELAPIAESAAELDLLGRYYAGRGNLDEGLAYERRAVSADPNCVPCLSAAAKMLNDKGHVREALEVATHAVGLLPDATRSNLLLEQLATYQRGLAARPDVPAPAVSATTSAAPPAATPPRPKPIPAVPPEASAPSR
jgi:tetratricopeptide (TPR) repeat protein